MCDNNISKTKTSPKKDVLDMNNFIQQVITQPQKNLRCQKCDLRLTETCEYCEKHICGICSIVDIHDCDIYFCNEKCLRVYLGKDIFVL